MANHHQDHDRSPNEWEPLVSIIIPTYEAEDTLSHCLTSIKDHWSDDIEVLIQDSNSKDRTTEIASSFSFVELHSTPDKGVYDAMNKAIARAQGRYVHFLGADDRLSRGFNRALKILKDSELDILYGNVLFGNEEKIYAGRFSRDDLALKNICHQAMFFKRGLLAGENGFDLSYPIYSDYVRNLQLFSDASLNIEHIDECIAYFSDTGMSNRKQDLRFVTDRPRILKRFGYQSKDAQLKALLNSASLNMSQGSLSRGFKDLLTWTISSLKFLSGLKYGLTFLKNRRSDA